MLISSAIYIIFFETFVTTLKPTEKPAPITVETQKQVNPVETIDPTVPELPIITFTGFIEKMDRPAPDIAYDYAIKLDTPYMDEHSESGGPALRNTYSLVSNDTNITQKLEQNVGNKVTITGRIEWGYAETKHFLVQGIK